jgi:uncharacterized protein with von Willebrand factor type A (vWA) domain
MEQGQMRLKPKAANIKNELIAAQQIRELTAVEQQQLDRLLGIEAMITALSQLTLEDQPVQNTHNNNNHFVNTTPQKPIRSKKTEDGSKK